MFYTVIGIVFLLVFIMYVVVTIIEVKHENLTNKFVHNSNLVDKWIICLDDCLLTRVSGDFWVGYSKKEKKPYSVNCAIGALGRYETEEQCRQIIVDISNFINDDNCKVYTIP